MGMSEKVLQRSRVLYNAIGVRLRERGFPDWAELSQTKELVSPGPGLEIVVPQTSLLWPLGVATRAAFDHFAEQTESAWLGTSVLESLDRPLMGVALMRESSRAWWVLQWMQQPTSPGLLVAQLRWYDDPQALYEKLSQYMDLVQKHPEGAKAAQFLSKHIQDLRLIAVRNLRGQLIG